MIEKEKFGKDHWSTFGYLGAVVTGLGGVPDKNRMRTDMDRHPGLVGPLLSGDTRRQKYPTRLAGGAMQEDHDDWDCVDDLEAAGLVTIGGTGIHPVWSLTDAGWAMLKKLTEFKAAGGTFATFCPW